MRLDGWKVKSLSNLRICQGILLLTVFFLFHQISSIDFTSSMKTMYINLCTITGFHGYIIEDRPKGQGAWTHGYIEVTGAGRLGNLMFKYASIVGLATKLHKIPILGPGKWSDLFNTFNIVSSERCLDFYARDTVLIEKHHSAFDPKLGNTSGQNIFIPSSFLQSWLYFHHITHFIRQVFKPKQTFRIKSQSYLTFLASKKLGKPVTADFTSKLIANNSVERLRIHGFKYLIGMHYRLGDIETVSNQKNGYVLPSRSYFKKAIKRILDELPNSSRNNTLFLLCSERGEKVEKIFGTLGIQFVVSHSIHFAVDFTLLTLMDALIITEGTFGWWAGFLGQGPVVYFDGFPRPGSPYDGNMNKTTYYPYPRTNIINSREFQELSPGVLYPSPNPWIPVS